MDLIFVAVCFLELVACGAGGFFGCLCWLRAGLLAIVIAVGLGVVAFAGVGFVC